MRKTFFIYIYMLLCITTSAAEDNVQKETAIQNVIMQLTDNQEKIFVGQHKSPAQVPLVSYDTQHIYITPHYDIPDAHIIIRDENENIIYDIYTSLSSHGFIITPSTDIMDNKYCIELVYYDLSYTGIF